MKTVPLPETYPGIFFVNLGDTLLTAYALGIGFVCNALTYRHIVPVCREAGGWLGFSSAGVQVTKALSSFALCFKSDPSPVLRCIVRCLLKARLSAHIQK